MTAEVVILNSEAVALAADSAVTADWGDGNFKVLHSQNKIFELTDSSHVAIMIYDRSRFMSLPLDIIIADYRRKYGHVTYPKLDDYVVAFTEHMVQVVDSQVSAEEQLFHQLRRVDEVFKTIRNLTNASEDSYIREREENGETVSPDERDRLLPTMAAHEIDRCLNLIRDLEAVEGFTGEVVGRAWAEMQPHVQEVREEWFGDDLTDDAKEKLDQVARHSISIMLGDLLDARLPTSGIVFAGFGDEELLPSYVEISIEAAYSQHLRMRRASENHIGQDSSSVIKAFAQTDMVAMFVEGVNPDYNRVVADVVHAEFEKLFTELAEDTGLTEEIRNWLADKLENLSSEYAGRVMGELHDSRGNYADRLLQAVESLSKTELTAMAESLISLTSLDRQVQISDESVGGPTDVAVITKADGFVWVRRKDTVARDLNPEYYARMSGRDS